MPHIRILKKKSFINVLHLWPNAKQK